MTDLPTSDALELELSGGWLTVWFNEPERRNPLTAARVAALAALCAALEGRRDVRGVTFRGRGGVFCAGGDLSAMRTDFQEVGADALQASRDAGRLYEAVDALPQVTVMAVEGAAMAGGLGLACAGDVVIVEASAHFALTETRIGLSPAQIAPFVLRRLGHRQGRRLMLTGAGFDGSDALEVGLADEVVEGAEGMDEVLARIRASVLRCAPGAVADTKALIRALPGLNHDGRIEAAAQVFAARMASEEGREGVASFLEKRRPAWAEDAS